MKILLDERVDSRLARYFPEFEVQTVHDRGWSVIVVHCISNRLADLIALVPDIQRVILSAARGTVTNVGRQAPP